uniref:Uncharacterized protein n=1 Tax=Strigamia maritima TaxID=126957 RepID=T1IHI7_STRMM
MAMARCFRGFHGIPRDSARFHEILRDFTGFYRIYIRSNISLKSLTLLRSQFLLICFSFFIQNPKGGELKIPRESTSLVTCHLEQPIECIVATTLLSKSFDYTGETLSAGMSSVGDEYYKQEYPCRFMELLNTIVLFVAELFVNYRLDPGFYIIIFSNENTKFSTKTKNAN